MKIIRNHCILHAGNSYTPKTRPCSWIFLYFSWFDLGKLSRFLWSYRDPTKNMFSDSVNTTYKMRQIDIQSRNIFRDLSNNEHVIIYSVWIAAILHESCRRLRLHDYMPYNILYIYIIVDQIVRPEFLLASNFKTYKFCCDTYYSFW